MNPQAEVGDGVVTEGREVEDLRIFKLVRKGDARLERLHVPFDGYVQ